MLRLEIIITLSIMVLQLLFFAFLAYLTLLRRKKKSGREDRIRLRDLLKTAWGVAGVIFSILTFISCSLSGSKHIIIFLNNTALAAEASAENSQNSLLEKIAVATINHFKIDADASNVQQIEKGKKEVEDIPAKEEEERGTGKEDESGGSPDSDTEDALTDDTAQQIRWSDWAFNLPEGVTANTHKIGTKEVYRGYLVESFDSDREQTETETLRFINATTEYSDWSEWSEDRPADQEGREIDTDTQTKTISTTTSTGGSNTSDQSASINQNINQNINGDNNTINNNTIYNNTIEQTNTQTTQNETITVNVYRYRDTSIVYHYEKFTLAVDWQDEPISQDQYHVVTATKYRYNL